MKTFISPQDIREESTKQKDAGKTVAFVPTMGALHQGHLSLVDQAREAADYVVVSIFVNPKQFGPGEDFATYPRAVKEDLRKLASIGADAVFLPSAGEMYPDGFQTLVTGGGMSKVLCGLQRPGHFDGVLTVVLKLFMMVQPDFAIFGKKDYQQLQVISTMVRDLNIPITIIGGDIVREEDGLAMSSRNTRLLGGERDVAGQIFNGLDQVRKSYESGVHQVADLLDIFRSSLISDLLKIQYAEIRDRCNLEEFANGAVDRPAVCAVAVNLGSVRLIDNIEIGC